MDYRQQELRKHWEGPEHRHQQDGTKLWKKKKSHTRDNVEYTVHARPFILMYRRD